jgi:hypothetical protein
MVLPVEAAPTTEKSRDVGGGAVLPANTSSEQRQGEASAR